MEKFESYAVKITTRFSYQEGAICKRYKFPNGYGGSVIKNEFSYGGREGLYEIAVIECVNGTWDLTYETPITSDVIGYVPENEVDGWLEKIYNLPEKQIIIP